MSDATRCPQCGASLKKYWHRLTPGLVKTLVKVYARVCEKGKNIIDKKELQLTHSEYGNFQKLRFHGLIAKNIVDGEWIKGEWVITHRGAQFLHGEIQIPIRVLTFRNRVEDHDEILVTVRDVIGTQPYFEKDFDYQIAKPVQASLI